MKINNKGYASTIIMFSILTLFLISMLMLVKTMNNSSTLNKKITEKVVDNINYDASGSVQDRLTTLENQLKNIENSMLDKIYPVGSVYISTDCKNITEVHDKIGGEWEVYASGRTLVSAGTYTKDDGNAIIYNIGEKGGNVFVTLNSSNIPSLPVTGTTNSTGNGYNISYTYTTRGTSSATSMTYRLVYAAGDGRASNHFTGFNGTNGYKDFTDNNFPGAAHGHNYNDYYANKISGVEAHTHTFTGNYTNNNVKDISIQNPYIVVYMYKRVK